MSWGWEHFQQIHISGWAIPLTRVDSLLGCRYCSWWDANILLIGRERRWFQKCQWKHSVSLSPVYQRLLLEQRQFLFETEAPLKLISFHSCVGKCVGHVLMSRLDRRRGNVGPRETVIVHSSCVPSLGCIRSPCTRVFLCCIVRTPHTFMLCLMSIRGYHAKSDPGSIDLDAN